MQKKTLKHIENGKEEDCVPFELTQSLEIRDGLRKPYVLIPYHILQFIRSKTNQRAGGFLIFN